MFELQQVNYIIESIEADATYGFFTESYMNILSYISDETRALFSSPSYADMFIVRMNINIPIELSSEQELRLTNALNRIIRQIYETYKKLGFNEQAISLLGSHVYINLEV